MYFSQFWGAGKSNTKVPADSVSGEDPLPGSSIALFTMTLHGKGGEGAFWHLILFSFFFFFPLFWQHMKFPGQGSDPSHSFNLH